MQQQGKWLARKMPYFETKKLLHSSVHPGPANIRSLFLSLVVINNKGPEQISASNENESKALWRCEYRIQWQQRASQHNREVLSSWDQEFASLQDSQYWVTQKDSRTKSLCSHFLPSTPCPCPWTTAFRHFHSSETQVLSGDIWVFTSITSLGGILQPKRKLTCSFPIKSSSTLIFYRKWKKRKKKTKY